MAKQKKSTSKVVENPTVEESKDVINEEKIIVKPNTVLCKVVAFKGNMAAVVGRNGEQLIDTYIPRENYKVGDVVEIKV